MAYSDENSGKSFSTMQEEAIRRVREMQRRSKSIVGDEPAPAFASREPDTKGSAPPDGLSAAKTGKSGVLGGLFDMGGVKLDEEKALIGILIYILYKQGADIKLLLALGYLLL